MKIRGFRRIRFRIQFTLMRRLVFQVQVLPLLLFAMFPALLGAQVKITRTPALIERRTFDPRRPPATMPKLRPGEVAITYTNFGADIQIGGEVTKASPAPEGIEAQVKIGTIDMTLRMNATIWL